MAVTSSAYRRKTMDVWTLFGNWGYGWEEVLQEYSPRDIRQRYNEYTQNNVDAVFKVKRSRVKIGNNIEQKLKERSENDGNNNI